MHIYDMLWFCILEQAGALLLVGLRIQHFVGQNLEQSQNVCEAAMPILPISPAWCYPGMNSWSEPEGSAGASSAGGRRLIWAALAYLVLI